MLYVGCVSDDTTCKNAGQFTLDGGNLNIEPLSSGPYSGIVLYQAHGDSQTVTFQGGSSSSSLNGVVYAPSAPVIIQGGSSWKFSALVCQSSALQ